jgi:putative ABC transport system permease protein
MAAVLFTLAFLTGNTLRQSLNDRQPEFAVLKAMGYQSGRLLRLALAEALLLCLPTALAGLGLAALARPLLRNDYVTILISGSVFATGIVCAALLAILSVAIPSWALARLPIVATLSKRA